VEWRSQAHCSWIEHDLQIKPTRTRPAEQHEPQLDAPTQRHWLHALPARLKVKGERINLTFRVIGG
jgi:hypothetical protein